ncbi:hypothetical protein BH10BAC1_BH10BAC1_09380 [soil metagenome]
MKQINKKSVYFENLDALRFVAFLAVFIQHIFSVVFYRPESKTASDFIDRFLMNANEGVNFFFVLSGFLITYILLKEKEEHTSIRFSQFYWKRSLRIWPLYFLILFIGFILVPYFSNYKGSPFTEKNLYVFFLGNFDQLKHGVGNFIVSPLWSISVEEQFYLLWPLFISIIPTKHLLKFFIALLLFSIWHRIFGHSGKTFQLKLSYHTFSCMYSLVIGAILAHLSSKENFILKLKNIQKPTIYIIYALGFLLIFIQKDIVKLEPKGSHYIISLLPIFNALFFAFIIAEQVFSKNSVFKIGKVPFFSALGKISYGLYCYHMLIIFLVFTALTKLEFNTGLPGTKLFLFEAIISFSLTIVIAHFSYKYLEAKFLQYKVKFSK